MAEATIDSLKLEIDSSSDGASQGLDALTKSLKKIQSVTRKGLGLGSIVTEIKQANSSVKSSSLDGLNKAIETLTKFSSIKISSSIGNQITAISTALQSANFNGGAEKMQSLVTALEPLGQLGTSNLSSYVSNLKKLPEVLNAIDDDMISDLTTKVTKLAAALKPLGDEMQKVANGFSAFPAKIQKLITSTDKLSTSNKKASDSYVNLYAKLKMAISAVKGIARTISGWITLSSDYTETMNLFTVSMGQYAEEAYSYAQRVGEAMGIDPAEWMKNQGVFMTLTKGFGVAGDRADEMSQQLTQLGYDLSSFFNISVEDAMTKLQSGISGELEPLRRLGYDLSQAKLEATALSLGIDKAVSSMTQAEKAELRYHAIMTQVTDAHQDMSRTLNAPANQLRVLNAQVTQLGRTLGNFFIPLLNEMLPYIIACVKVLREALTLTMALFGIELAEVDFGSSSLTSFTEDVVSNLEDGTEEAKKLKSYMLGFDELNVLDSNEESENLYGAGFEFKLPTYDFITDSVVSRADALLEDAKDILATIGAVGAGFAAWAIPISVLKGLKEIRKLVGKKIVWSNLLIGLSLFLQDLTTMQEYLKDFVENGATFEAVTGILSTFTGMIGDVLIALGKTEIGGALKVVEGIGQIVSEIAKISKEGVDADGIMDICNALSNIMIGIGALTKNWQMMGIGMTLQGFTTIIDELAENWEAIKRGDWSGIDVAALAIGAIEIIAGIITALGVFKKAKKVFELGDTAGDMVDVGSVVGEVTKTTSTLTTKLTSLVKNLGLAIVVIAEVAVAAGIIIGAIWGLGVLLDEAGQAWQPVIDNAGTVAIAIGMGTVLLVAIGTGSAALGAAGKALVVDLALGTAMLALVGVNAALFLGEILMVTELLDKIGKAWQPVLDNGENIARAIGIGTGILLAIGIASAALGALTLATGGTVALALAAGTAMLALIGVNAVLFLAEIKVVGESLEKIDKAWRPVLDNGETIAKGIGIGTALLIGIGVVSAALGVAAVASVGLLPLAIALGTAMLVELAVAFSEFCKSLSSVAKDITDTLAPSLGKMNGVLPKASSDMADFTSFMGDFAGKAVKFSVSNAIAGIAATVDKIIDFFTTDPIKRMADNVKKQYEQAKALYDELIKAIPKIKDATEKMKEYNKAMDEFEKTAGLGSDKNGISGYVLDFVVNIKNTATTWWSNVKNWWSGKVGSVDNFNTNVNDNSSSWWSNVKSWWKADSRNGVDLEVNPVKGWTGALKNALGINENISLGFKLPKIRVKWSEKEVLGFKITFPSGFETYAQGGFPEQGQMFIAREAGAELVGNIGGRTAVMNNDQIVESVSAGVYQAVLAALGGNNDEGGETNIVINLDGEKIYENQQKIARGRGYNLGMGAFSFG